MALTQQANILQGKHDKQAEAMESQMQVMNENVTGLVGYVLARDDYSNRKRDVQGYKSRIMQMENNKRDLTFQEGLKDFMLMTCTNTTMREHVMNEIKQLQAEIQKC